MRSREDVEAYLMRGGQPYEEVAPDTWVIHDTAQRGLNTVVRLAEDLVIFRVKVLDLSSVSDFGPLFDKLLRLNANEMLEASWGIADGSVVLTAARRLENLDFNEFQGVVDELALALAKHYEPLSAFRSKAS